MPILSNGCSAVLISPRVLLTVASCLDPQALPTEVYFGTTGVGVAPASSMAMDRAGREDNDLGAAVTIVAWGALDSDGTGAGVKRSGETTIIDVQDPNIQFGDMSVTTCRGDGGGPVVMDVDGTPTVIALSSFGPPSCDGPAGGPRVDLAVTSFIDPFVAANDPDAPDPDVDDPIVDDGDDGVCAVCPYSARAGGGKTRVSMVPSEAT